MAVVEPLPETAAAPTPPGHPWIAWTVILLLVALFVTAPPVQGVVPEAGGGMEQLNVELMGRSYVGAKQILSDKEAQDLYLQAEQALNTGPVGQRLRFVVLAGELAGPDEALRTLRGLDQQLREHGVALTRQQAAVREVLGKLYTDYAGGKLEAPSLQRAERERLRRQLGWYGELALAPQGGPRPEVRQELIKSAQRTVLAFFGLLAGFALAGLAGMVGLVVVLVMLLSGRVESGLAHPSPYGAIYVETFAVWLVLQLVLSEAARAIPAGESRILLSGGAALMGLLALGWPVLRGVPWRQTRQDIGLYAGRRPALELLAGAATYIMAIPLMIVGVMLTYLLVFFQAGLRGGGVDDQFSSPELPSHPIAGEVVGNDWWVWLQVLFLASVVAPLVEETMFRGVLYRHLREATRRFGIAVSGLASATLVSFIFAVIHPQGLLAVPGLMALAFAFALAREWRGTLLPAMVAHGISNGLVLLLLYLLSRI